MRFPFVPLAVAVVCAMKATAAVGAPGRPEGKVIRAVHSDGEIPSIEFEKYELANGLQVILAEDNRIPFVAFDLWFDVGAKNERPGLTGLAHLFEHLMMGASKHIPAGLTSRLIQDVGGMDANGQTGFESTNYHFTLPSTQLELGLWIQSDRIGYMIDAVDPAVLARHKDVVRNERRQTVENRPYGLGTEAIYQQLFPPGHPYHAALMGSHADIQAATIEDVKSFFKSHYTPGNATLTLVGDFQRARAKRLIEKYFGSLSSRPSAPPATIVQPQIAAERRAVKVDRVPREKVSLVWHTSPAYKAGNAALDLAAFILGGDNSSRLHRTLVRQKQIAQEAHASQNSMAAGSIFLISAKPEAGHTALEVEKALDEELARLATQPPLPEEMEKARLACENAIYRRLERLSDIARQLNVYNQMAGDPGFLPRDVARYRSVEASEVTREVAAQLRKQARAVIHVVPGKPDLPSEVAAPAAAQASRPFIPESVNPDQTWRARQPRGRPARPAALFVGKSFRLSNGLTVIHAPKAGAPLVTSRLVLKAGASANPRDLPGLAGFTAAMLNQGTENRSAPQLAESLARIGASLDVRAAREETHVSITSSRTTFREALDILGEIILRPAFPAAEVERQRKSRLQALVAQREDPAQIAAAVAAASLFGPDHPLGASPLGTKTAIEATSRDQLRSFWRRYYRPENAALVVAGHIERGELQTLVNRAFEGWAPAGDGSPEADLPVPVSTGARLVLVDRPGAGQTVLHAIAPGIRASDRDEPSLTIMNGILGDNPTNRINTALRSRKGYSYGVYSDLWSGRQFGTFNIRGSVRTDVTGAAIAELLAEIAEVGARPVPGPELVQGRDFQVLSAPAMFTTNDDTAANLATSWARGQPIERLNRRLAKMAAVTAQDVLSMARKYVRPQQLIVVAVGDKAKILPQLAPGVRPEIRDADGNIVAGGTLGSAR